jgi:hypothetical protein
VPQAGAQPHVVLRQAQNLPEVGLHQCPSERKGEGGPVRSLHVPSHVPSHPQNAAKVRGFSPSASAFTAETDCLLEGTGFEPAVPLLRRFCRAVNPDAVMKTEAPKVRSRRRRLPGAPSYSYSVRGGTGSSNLPSFTGESANHRSRESFGSLQSTAPRLGSEKSGFPLALHLTIYSWRDQGADRLAQ